MIQARITLLDAIINSPIVTALPRPITCKYLGRKNDDTKDAPGVQLKTNPTQTSGMP